MSDTGNPGLFCGFRATPNEGGGGNLVNLVASEVLKESFRFVDRLEEADLQISSLNWEAPARPRRLFIDHGSFADASFWTYTASRLRLSDTILVASSVCRRVADRFFEGEGPAVNVVPFPVDTGRFRPAGDRRAARLVLREEFGIPEAGPLLLLAAAFVRRKNHHLAVRFVERLRREVPGARLAIAGDTPDRPASHRYRAAVEELVLSSGLEGSVDFVGALTQERLARFMAGADLLVHLTTCRLENYGLVVAEAMAAGLPVVGSDWGGLRDLVSHGETGLLARTYLSDRGPRTDWSSLVRETAECLGNRDRWNEMSRRARTRAVSHLGRTAYAERLRAAVRAALDRPGGPGSPIAFSAAARELVFRTIALNAMHPEIGDAGDEFRLLMPLDGGSHYRFLAGPAATSERAPRISPDDRLYPVASWEARGDGIEITDPAWPAHLALGDRAIALLECCDGTRTLGIVMNAMGAPPAELEAVLGTAQSLVDGGVLCPLEQHS